MQCEHVRRELVTYQHGTLSTQDRAAIEAHLSSCEACSEEAKAMKEIGDLLSRGLRDWVDQGVCPPQVAERIELSIRSIHRRPWWQRWPAVVGTTAAVAVVLVIVLSSQPQWAHQMASVPLLGALATQLVDPDVEIHADPGRPITATLFRPTRTVDLAAGAEIGGVTLTVERVATDGKLTRVQYTVEGEGLALPEETAQLAPTLTTAKGEVPFQGLTANRKGEAILFVAYFEAIPAGEKLTLAVPSLTTQKGEQKGPWTVDFAN